MSRPADARPDITTDPAHGGRWTSLRAHGREWLWHRAAPERETVRPGDAFVDAGGLEECIPTVRGTPDHGDAWSRPWTREGDTERVRCDDFTLARTLRGTADGAVADYTLTAEPGFRFVWAAHALLAVSADTTVRIRPGATTRRSGSMSSGRTRERHPVLGTPADRVHGHRMKSGKARRAGRSPTSASAARISRRWRVVICSGGSSGW